ncbi:MAG: hypothetical protein Q8Q10_02020 [bacterium]|nr:hypothetical protein [bacterium]
MLEQSSRTLKVALSVLCVAMLAVLALVILGENDLLGKKALAPQPTTTTSQSQPQSAQPIPATEVRRVFGTVEKISGNEITLKDVKKILNTGAKPVNQSAQTVITVDQATVVERYMRKDMLVFGKELDDFAQNRDQSASTPPRPPVPFTLEKVTLSDIKVGDIITASSLKDIATLTTFTATTIAIQN